MLKERKYPETLTRMLNREGHSITNSFNYYHREISNLYYRKVFSELHLVHGTFK